MFEPISILLQRGPVSQEEPYAAPEGLEVDFEAGDRLPDETSPTTDAYGHDVVMTYPARIGERAGRLIRRVWTPAFGYSAEGVEDTLVL